MINLKALKFLIENDGWSTHKEIRQNNFSWLDMAQLHEQNYIYWKHVSGEWEYTYSDNGKEFIENMKG